MLLALFKMIFAETPCCYFGDFEEVELFGSSLVACCLSCTCLGLGGLWLVYLKRQVSAAPETCFGSKVLLAKSFDAVAKLALFVA